MTVSGNIDPNVLIKKLAKSRKHAELWCAPKENNNNNSQNNMANQMKNIQIDNGNGGGENNNNNGQRDPRSNQNQPKGGVQQEQNPQPQLQQQLQQLQQLHQVKGFEDIKGPQFKDTNRKMPPPNQNPNMKGVKFNLPEDDDDFTDDELDEFDDDEYSDEEFDSEIEHPLNKMKLPMGGNGPAHMMMNAQKGAVNVGGNEMKGGGGSGGGHVPVQVHTLGGGNGNGGKQAGGGGGGNNQSHNQGGGNKINGDKYGAGMLEGKIGNKNVGSGGVGGSVGIPNNNMGKKVNGIGESGVQDVMNNGLLNMGFVRPNAGHIDSNNMSGMLMGGGAMGNNMPMMSQMGGNMSVVQGLPEAAMNHIGGGRGYVGGGYGGPEMMMGGNPYQQQQYMTPMLNQEMTKPACGNDIFQPMMYARPPMAVNNMCPPPYSYPPPPQHRQDPYSNFFNDENTSSCSVM